jgi:CheY-like chemotaxis protein
MMPVKDGYEFVKELRTYPLLAAIPVLLVSAGPINKAKLTPYRAEAYLNKPFELDQLETTVHDLIDKAY